MPHLYRLATNQLYSPGKTPISLRLSDGSEVEAFWAGSATIEKMHWWLNVGANRGNVLAQTDYVSSIAVRNEVTKEIKWGEAPANARLMFVVKPYVTGKNGQRYRLAMMVTTAATSAQALYFGEPRFALFGNLNPDGSIKVMAPLDCPPPDSLLQQELF